jgi:hypothetical protein
MLSRDRDSPKSLASCRVDLRKKLNRFSSLASKSIPDADAPHAVCIPTETRPDFITIQFTLSEKISIAFSRKIPQQDQYMIRYAAK